MFNDGRSRPAQHETRLTRQQICSKNSLRRTLMSTAVMTNRLELSSVAATALKVAVRCWFAVALAGQLLFAFTVASFYGMASMRGDWRAWNKGTAHRYVS